MDPSIADLVIVKCVTTDVSTAAIAREHGVSDSAIRRLLKKHGITRPHMVQPPVLVKAKPNPSDGILSLPACSAEL